MATIEISRSQDDNLTRLYVGNVVVWFSHSTPVAFHVPGQSRKVSENVWSQTTGRHLNDIDGGAKSSRIPHEQFKAEYDEAMQRVQKALDAAFSVTA